MEIKNDVPSCFARPGEAKKRRGAEPFILLKEREEKVSVGHEICSSFINSVGVNRGLVTRVDKNRLKPHEDYQPPMAQPVHCPESGTPGR